MGLCATATLQLLSEAAIHLQICAEFQTRDKSQVSRSQECLECRTLYRNQTCQRMSYGVQMNGQGKERGAEDGRTGGGTASCRYVKVKLNRNYSTEVESKVKPDCLRFIQHWWMLRE